MNSEEQNIADHYEQAPSEGPDVFERKAQELGDPVGETAHVTRLKILQFTHLSEMALEQEKAAETFFLRNRLADTVRRFVIPALYEYAEGDERALRGAIELCEMHGMEPGTWPVLCGSKDYYESKQGEFTEVLRMLLAVYTLKKRLLEKNILLFQFNTKDGQMSLGIGEVHSKEHYGYKDEAPLFCSASIHHPHLMPPRPFGMHDPHTGLAIVNRSAADIAAAEMLAVRKKGYGSGSYRSRQRHAARFRDETHLADVMHDQALCEEVRHQLNLRHSDELLGEGQKDDPRHRVLYLEKRLRPDASLRELMDRSDEHKMEELAQITEEANAKLTEIAVGPDPRLSVAMLFDCLARFGERTRSGLPSDYRLVIELLRGHAYAEAEKTQEDLHKEDNEKLLRLAAVRALDTEFFEEWNEMPFCNVNGEGALIPHVNTHPYFARWA